MNFSFSNKILNNNKKNKFQKKNKKNIFDFTNCEIYISSLFNNRATSKHGKQGRFVNGCLIK